LIRNNEEDEYRGEESRVKEGRKEEEDGEVRRKEGPGRRHIDWNPNQDDSKSRHSTPPKFQLGPLQRFSDSFTTHYYYSTEQPQLPESESNPFGSGSFSTSRGGSSLISHGYGSVTNVLPVGPVTNPPLSPPFPS
jgi:hypothetical protein